MQWRKILGESNHNLTALIGSRICHDLISPVGAISNGLELLEMSGDINGPEMGLIRDSVGNAGARIRFFRIAFGGEGDQMMGASEITAVLNDYASGSRLSLNWLTSESHERSCVKLAFLAIQCLETAMPFGGSIDVDCQNDQWTVTGTSAKLTIEKTLWDGLLHPADLQKVLPAQVQFALMPDVAHRADRSIRTEQTSDQLSILF